MLTPSEERCQGIMNNVFPADSLRSSLLQKAYYITGSFIEAEDIVQEAYLKWVTMDTQSVENPGAYLTRMVVHLAINWKKKLTLRRAAYYGEWLPEPVATERADGIIDSEEKITYSLLVILERLNAKERAVFILKEAFDYDHSEIANLLTITPTYSRKLLSRAKRRIDTVHSASIPHDEQLTFLNRFRRIIQSGDMAQLETLLREDIVAVSDGGGKASAGKHPVTGRHRVARMLLGLYRKFYRDVVVTQTFVGGQMALLYWNNGAIRSCQIFALNDGRLQQVYLVRNPDKLASLQKNHVAVTKLTT